MNDLPAGLLAIVIGFGVSLQASAQVTGTVRQDSVELDAEASTVVPYDSLEQNFFQKVTQNPYPNPERAALLSFALPGAGQVYNKRFWYLKVPVIYGGLAFLITNGEQNRKQRNEFQAAYLAVTMKPDTTHQFSGTRFDAPNTLRINRDNTDKNFQLSYIGVAILHLVQTLEAYTTSHLLEFDMDESLTLRPTLVPGSPTGAAGSTFGLAVTVPLGRRRAESASEHAQSLLR